MTRGCAGPRGVPGADRRQDREAHRQYWTGQRDQGHRDKEFPGAVVSSLADPWGQATAANTATNGLRTWHQLPRDLRARLLRDVHGLPRRRGPRERAPRRGSSSTRCSCPTAASRATRSSMGPSHLTTTSWSPTSRPSRSSWPGSRDWERPGLYTEHVLPAADFLVAHGPVYGDERWEDQAGYSPSNIATEIAGLVSAAAIAQAERGRGGPALSRHGRRLAAQRRGLDGDEHRPLLVRSVFPALVQDGDPNSPTSTTSATAALAPTSAR